MNLFSIGYDLEKLQNITFNQKIGEQFEYLYLENKWYAVRNNITNELKIVEDKNPIAAVEAAFPEQMIIEELKRLLKCFYLSKITQHFEFIAYEKKCCDAWIGLYNIKKVKDFKIRIISALSRGAYKTIYYSNEKKNEEIRTYIRKGINDFLGTNFSKEDMEVIYTYLGNKGTSNPGLIERFIDSGYDMHFFKDLT